MLAVEDDAVWLDVAGKRMRLDRSVLEPIAASHGAAPARPSAPASPQAPGPAPTAAMREIILIGRRLDEAIEEVERAIDAAILAGDAGIRVVHGHGTGRLRDGLRAHLRAHAAVSAIRPADRREGGDGATVVELR